MDKKNDKTKMGKTIGNSKVLHQVCEMQNPQTKSENFGRSFKNKRLIHYLVDVLLETSIDSYF